MKKTPIFMAILLAVLVPSLSFAQNVAVFTTKEEIKPSETITTPPAEIKSQPLSVKKQYVETQLKNLLSQLGTITNRTQVALDRLSEKDINTVTAQTELDKAGVALNNARTNIDAFSTIQVTAADDADKVKAAALTITLKETVKKAEDNLKISRDALIQSLGLLKTSINASISSETE